MRRATLCLLLAMTAAAAGQQTVAPPDTPAGHVLAAWLAAFNSMDRAQVESYVKQYDPKNNADGMLGFARQVGGFTLIAIDQSEPLSTHFRVRERGGTTVGAGSIEVNAAEPHTVEHLRVLRIPPGATVEWKPIDAAERQRVIAGVADNLDKFYVYPDSGKAMTAAIEAKDKHGDYNSITDGSAFAERLTNDLQSVSHDHHLGVQYSPAVDDGKHGDGPSEAEQAAMRKNMERENCGFSKVEILPRNIGYIKFDFFGDPAICGPIAASAMGFIAHTDAVIFDLRENHGGDPHMVEVVASYLFDKPTHLNDLVDRAANETTQYWTEPSLPGPRLASQPVYVLTSHETFSGGEEFTYDLQTQKRRHHRRRDHRRRRPPGQRPPYRRPLWYRRPLRPPHQPRHQEGLGGHRRHPGRPCRLEGRARQGPGTCRREARLRRALGLKPEPNARALWRTQARARII